MGVWEISYGSLGVGMLRTDPVWISSRNCGRCRLKGLGGVIWISTGYVGGSALGTVEMSESCEVRFAKPVMSKVLFRMKVRSLAEGITLNLSKMLLLFPPLLSLVPSVSVSI